MIAEPWDTGPDGYQVGNFPPGWAEWNDRYRDTVRGFWKGDDGTAPHLASHLLGSAGSFEKRGRRPWATINFVTAHDGFTLADLVSCNDKHNEANQEDNRDGHDNNLSWNCGAEGPTEDQGILDLRDRMRRNILATLLLSQGTPMILMGDENGRSQGGNNNAYCQDNEMNWLHWTDIGERDQAFQAFVRGLIRLRRTRPLLRQSRFLRGTDEDDQGDVRWLRSDGQPMEDADWTQPITHSFAVLLSGEGERLLLLFNAHYEAMPFALPEPYEGGWKVLIDTSSGAIEPKGETLAADEIKVEGRTLFLLESRE